MGAQSIDDQHEDGGCDHQNPEPAQRFEQGIQATRHFCHTPIAEPDRLDRYSLAILCGAAVGQLWRSVAKIFENYSLIATPLNPATPTGLDVAARVRSP
jgi:hypothetical protein